MHHLGLHVSSHLPRSDVDDRELCTGLKYVCRMQVLGKGYHRTLGVSRQQR